MEEENILFKKLDRPLELEVRGEDAVHIYLTKLMDVAPESVSVLAPKDQHDKVVAIEGGTRLKLIVTEGGVVFTFDTMVLGAKLSGTVPLLILQKPARMERVQRRNNFRVPTEEFPCTVTYAEDEQPENLKATCKEISGGGMMIVVERNIPKDGNIEITFQLSEEPEIFSLIGEVKRVEQLQRVGITEYRLGIFFCNISDRQREKIIKYTFRQQRKLIQRGLL